jgi:Saccharopine dehydrogenase NADP binding domain
MIAIVGAGGVVGRGLAGALTGAEVRLGSRRPAPGQHRVDAADARTLAGFCAGADVVVNCVGPIGRSRPAVLAAAARAGAAYVDAAALGSDEHLLSTTDGRPALFGAGAVPGASELLLRWAAARLPRPPATMTAYTATLDRMTPGSAADFLSSLGGDHGTPGGSLVDGMVVAHAVPPLAAQRLPFIPDEVTGVPFLSSDAAAVGRRIGVRELRCYQLFDTGSPVLAALNRRLPHDPGAAEQLRSVVDAVVAGRSPYQVFIVESVDGDRAEIALARVPSTYGLTAAVLAAAVLAVDDLPSGRHRAAEVLAPHLFAACVRAAGGRVWTLDGALSGYADVDAGAV